MGLNQIKTNFERIQTFCCLYKAALQLLFISNFKVHQEVTFSIYLPLFNNRPLCETFLKAVVALIALGEGFLALTPDPPEVVSRNSSSFYCFTALKSLCLDKTGN